MNRKVLYSMLAVVLLVIAMYTASGGVSQKEIIFPELAALAVGAWVLGNQRWLSRPLLICISPTLAAVTGTIIVHFLSQYQVVAILLAFVLVSIELWIMRSQVTPSISAAILPIFLQIDSLYYPIAVGVLTAIIALPRLSLLSYQKRLGASQKEPFAAKVESAATQAEQGTSAYGGGRLGEDKKCLKWLGIFAGVSLITLIAFITNWKFIVAPPLIVTFVEIIQHRAGVSGQRFKLVLLLGCASIWGTLSMIVLHNMVHLPLAVVAGSSVIGVLILFKALKLSFPPAMAIALLPTIISSEDLLLYSVQVVTGAFLFIVLSRFYITR